MTPGPRGRKPSTFRTGWVDGKEVLRIGDNAGSLTDGGFAFVCEEGLITSDEITIKSKKRIEPAAAIGFL